MLTRIRVEIDDLTLSRLREQATEERRPTAEQAAVVLARVMARRAKQRERRAEEPLR
jgi:hypothetical protein